MVLQILDQWLWWRSKAQSERPKVFENGENGDIFGEIFVPNEKKV